MPHSDMTYSMQSAINGSATPTKKPAERTANKIVRCSNAACNKFMFEAIITATEDVPGLKTGALVRLKKVKCAACGWRQDIDFGISERSDPDDSSKVVKHIEQIRKAPGSHA